ncbi:thiamine pyridinylase [Fimbriiglobus ruber]|uniref:Thiaminase-1 n=1 Tax=Fimbriiglobus ruber TaxID=1908690 RepID=A0A225D8P7_9BACT|nr:thiamine pyridinylase [Fimbriiglobus ruber]OWK34908.1 Thiaminase-1 precursor [Fimbriiglobus ruber]
MTRTVLLLFALLGLSLGVSAVGGQQPSPEAKPVEKTKLKVALFSLVDSNLMQEVLRAMWREKHPTVELKFVGWDSYKQDPAEGVDVFEYDAIFLDYMVKNGLVAKLDKSEVKDAEDFFDFAVAGSKVGGDFYGIPRIACTPVIFYRAGDEAIEKAKSIEELHKILGDRLDAPLEPKENEGLLINLSGSTSCACYYLDAVSDGSGTYSPMPALPEATKLDATALKNLQRLTRMGGREQVKFEDKVWTDDKRSEWFAQGKGRAMVGWTERLSAIPVEQHAKLKYRPFPLAESNAVNLLYVDMLSVSPKLDEGRKKLALEFANFAASKDAVMATFLARNAKTSSPQYLLPVRKSVAESTELRTEAPFYNDLVSILNEKPQAFRIGDSSRKWLADNRKAIQATIVDVK